MLLLLEIAAIIVGLALGVVAGYWIGQRWESSRRMLWTMAGLAFATVWVIDLAGYVVGRPEISVGSIGLMAGLLTGIKYGGFPEVRIWDKKAAPSIPIARTVVPEPQDPSELPGERDAGRTRAPSPAPAPSPGTPTFAARTAAAASRRSDAPTPEDADASQKRGQ